MCIRDSFWAFVDEAVTEKGDGFSISDINRKYVECRAAMLLNVGEETWVDCGTPATLLQASIMAKEGRLDPRPHKDETRRHGA